MSKIVVYNTWVVCLYFGFHNIISNNFGYLCDNIKASLFDNKMLCYAFFIHSIHYTGWALINAFMVYMSNKCHIFVLHYMVLYNNLHIYLKHANNLSFDYFKLSQGTLWMFTSPYILYVYSNLNNIDMSKEIFNDILMHGINIIYNISNIYSTYTFEWINTCLIVVMYILYTYNVLMFWRRKTQDKHYIIYSWLLIGLNESLFFMKMIDNDTYTLFTLINDIQVKSLMFGLVCTKFIEIEYFSKDLSIFDLKKLYEFKSYLEREKSNHKFANRTLCDINNVLANVKLSRVRKSLSERVICKDFTDSFINSLIKFKNKSVKNVVVIFSDVVDYSRISSEKNSCDIVKILQELYDAYDDILAMFTNLQKIENIGDCYMATSMLDKKKIKNNNPCSESINFATKVIEIANAMHIQIRVGIHIGNVSIGIIGKDIPRFGVVGHDVNVASRLESTCKINCIQMSKNFRELLKKEGYDTTRFVSCEVELKNIGKHQTFTYDPKLDGYCE